MAERFKDHAGYKFDRYIFRGVIILIIIYFFGVWIYNIAGSGNINPFAKNLYLSCPYNSPCVNPVYNYCTPGQPCDKALNIPENIRIMETLPAGFKYGFFNWPAKLFGFIVFLELILAFVFNHFLYNKGYDFRRLNDEKA